MRLYVAILTLALQQQCSVTELMTQGPEFVRSRAEQSLKPYFPHAQARIVNGNMLLAITCADLGAAAINELQPSLDNNQGVKQLKTIGPFVGIRTFALGFPDTILELDLATKQYHVVPASTVPRYSYMAACNPSEVPALPPTEATAVPSRVFRPGNGVSPPAVLSRVEPQYTEEARKAKCQGTVVLEAIVRANGSVDVLRVARSVGCADLDEAAVQNLKQWRFRPGMKDGMPVDVAINIEVNFILGR